MFLKRKESRKTIGVMGTERGSGVTHLCIALATFLSLEYGAQVILAEFGKEGGLKEIKSGKDQTVYGVVYRYEMTKDDILDLMNENYDFLIMDFGSDFTNNYEEFMRCTKKIITGSFAFWRWMAYEDKMKRIVCEKNYKDWDYCILYGDKEDKKEFHALYQIIPKSVPFFKNPYQLGEKEFQFLQELVQKM